MEQSYINVVNNCVVYRYPINNPEGISTIEIPEHAQFLNCGIGFNQDGKEEISVWFFVDPNQPVEKHTFLVVGTGVDVSKFNISKFVGTVQKSNQYAFHVFLLNNVI